mmetsp:Transcript_29934/g.64523  ORF Transcript_29934/g.64523 Transcript_29934/m.64523 type:complete len:188 (+) Transcript_29934:764-1327(+)
MRRVGPVHWNDGSAPSLAMIRSSSSSRAESSLASSDAVSSFAFVSSAAVVGVDSPSPGYSPKSTSSSSSSSSSGSNGHHHNGQQQQQQQQFPPQIQVEDDDGVRRETLFFQSDNNDNDDTTTTAREYYTAVSLTSPLAEKYADKSPEDIYNIGTVYYNMKEYARASDIFELSCQESNRELSEACSMI